MQKIKVTHILLSCSFLLTTAITTPSGAMGSPTDGEEILYHTSRNYLYVDPERTMGSMAITALTDGHSEWVKSLTKKAERTYDIFNKMRGGDYGDLTGEVIEGFVAHLMGNGLYHQLLQTNTNFDSSLQADAVTQIQMHLFSFVARQIAQDRQRYGVVNNTGERVTIYNDTSLFRMIAEKLGADQVPFGSIVIKALDYDPVKKFLANKFNQLVLNQLSTLTVNMTGKTIKNHVGTQFVNLINIVQKGAVTSAKSSANYLFGPVDQVPTSNADVLKIDEHYEPLWAYLEPHITHYLRQTFEDMLKKSQAAIVDSFIKKAQQSSAPIIKKGLKVGMTGFGGLTGYFIAGYSGGASGMVIGNTFSEFAGTYVSGMAHHQIEQFGKIANEQLDKFIKWKMHTLFKYGKEEHALYHLNPNQPTHLELALFYEDYRLRAELESHTFLGSVIKQLNHSFTTVDLFMRAVNLTSNMIKNVGGGVIDLYGYLSNSKDHSSLEDQQNVTALSGKIESDVETALRQYIWLKNKPYLTAQEKLILKNIEEYPSYAIKGRLLGDLNKQFQTIDPNEYIQLMMASKSQAKNNLDKVTLEVEQVEQSIAEICLWYQHLTSTMGKQDYFSYVALQDLLEKQVFLLPLQDQERFAEVAQDEKYIKEFLSNKKNRALLACSFKEKEDTQTVSKLINQLLLDHTEFKYRDDLEKLQQHSFAQGMSIEKMMELLTTHHKTLAQEGLLNEMPEDVSTKVQNEEINLIKTRFFELIQESIAQSYFKRYQTVARDYVRAQAFPLLKQEKNLEDLTNLLSTIYKKLGEDQYFQAFLEPIRADKLKNEEDRLQKGRTKLYSLVKTQNVEWVKEFKGELETNQENAVKSIHDTSSLKLLPGVDDIENHIYVYDNNDVQGFNLAELYNIYMTESFKTIKTIEESDFAKIWEMLNAQKEEKLKNRNVSVDDLAFIQKYKTEIFNIRIKEDKFKDKLFYGYIDLVSELRYQNAKILVSLQK